MARRKETITIETPGRDLGKVFIVTEMPATVGERWASQALFLIRKQLGEVVEDSADPEQGMSDLAATGATLGGMQQVALLKALQDPSLDGWWDCVRYQHNPKHEPQPIYQDARCQIEEISTITQLRIAVLGLHTAFFSAADASTSELPSQETGKPISSVIATSRVRSAR